MIHRVRTQPFSARFAFVSFETLLVVSLAVLFVLSGVSVARAQTLSVAETEALVRADYFEGLPEEMAVRIGPAGAERLVEMLFDPDERRSHGQILLALGLSGSPDAMVAILEWQRRFDRVATPGAGGTPRAGRVGEIDRDGFRAWQALPYALGYMARTDRRAVVELEGLMNAEAPEWTFRHHKGARLHDLARRSAATALALTGLPEARSAFDRAGRAGSDARFEAHLRAVRALHAEQTRKPVQ